MIVECQNLLLENSQLLLHEEIDEQITVLSNGVGVGANTEDCVRLEVFTGLLALLVQHEEYQALPNVVPNHFLHEMVQDFLDHLVLLHSRVSQYVQERNLDTLDVFEVLFEEVHLAFLVGLVFVFDGGYFLGAVSQKRVFDGLAGGTDLVLLSDLQGVRGVMGVGNLLIQKGLVVGEFLLLLHPLSVEEPVFGLGLEVSIYVVQGEGEVVEFLLRPPHVHLVFRVDFGDVFQGLFLRDQKLLVFLDLQKVALDHLVDVFEDLLDFHLFLKPLTHLYFQLPHHLALVLPLTHFRREEVVPFLLIGLPQPNGLRQLFVRLVGNYWVSFDGVVFMGLLRKGEVVELPLIETPVESLLDFELPSVFQLAIDLVFES